MKLINVRFEKSKTIKTRKSKKKVAKRKFRRLKDEISYPGRVMSYGEVECLTSKARTLPIFTTVNSESVLALLTSQNVEIAMSFKKFPN